MAPSTENGGSRPKRRQGDKRTGDKLTWRGGDGGMGRGKTPRSRRGPTVRAWRFRRRKARRARSHSNLAKNQRPKEMGVGDWGNAKFMMPRLPCHPISPRASSGLPGTLDTKRRPSSENRRLSRPALATHHFRVRHPLHAEENRRPKLLISGTPRRCKART